jgi:hypothetical protein
LGPITEEEERLALTTVATVLLVFLAGPVIRSPDGMEMLRLSARWLGQPATVGDPYFWPPLWSVLNMPAVAAGHAVGGARVLNLLLWGLVVWPLHSLSTDLGGRAVARRAVVLFLALPMVGMFSPILDARALGMLITTGFIAAAVRAALGGVGLPWVVFLGAVAPLARPEGVLLTALVGPIVWMIKPGRWRWLVAGGVSLLPHALLRGTLRGMTGHEQLFAPWYGTWSTWDMLSLFGPASVPTEFRRFALAAVEAGVVEARPSFSDLGRVLSAAPEGLSGALLALVSGVGVVGLVLALRGFRRVNRSSRPGWTVALVVIPLLVIAVAPMARDQSTLLNNWLFLMPALISLIAVGALVRRRKLALSWLLMAVVVTEAHFSPLQGATPYFLEGSQAADLARAMLERNPPPSGAVATGFSGRDVVLGAGLNSQPLGPIWAGSVPEAVDAVLISSVDARGEDGGRSLQLLESAAWSVAWVVGDEDLDAMAGRPYALARWDRGWYALLRRR